MRSYYPLLKAFLAFLNAFSQSPAGFCRLPKARRMRPGNRGKPTQSLGSIAKHTGVHTGRYCSLPGGLGSYTRTISVLLSNAGTCLEGFRGCPHGLGGWVMVAR